MLSHNKNSYFDHKVVFLIVEVANCTGTCMFILCIVINQED